MFRYLEHKALHPVYVRIIQESKTVFLAREVMERMNGLMRKFARRGNGHSRQPRMTWRRG
jgi:hypothetical protein